jgi:hypothetical protein
LHVSHAAITDRCTLLTGISRGGTTLVCELLNRLPDVRALDEPMDPNQLVRDATLDDGRSLDAARILAGIERFAEEQRRSILERGVAVSLNIAGGVFGARVSDARDERGLRQPMGRRCEIPVDPPASPDFKLVIKHPVAFTALLPILRDRFEVFAVVRNPLAVLASWESVPFAQREGRLGLRPQLAPEIDARLEETEDRLERQLMLLDWFFASYASTLPRERVVRYEDIVSTGGTALAPLAATAAELMIGLESRNTALVYDRSHMRQLGSMLLDRGGGPWLAYYTRAEIGAVMTAAGA